MSGIEALKRSNKPQTAREQRVAQRAFYLGYLLGVLAATAVAICALIT